MRIRASKKKVRYVKHSKKYLEFLKKFNTISFITHISSGSGLALNNIIEQNITKIKKKDTKTFQYFI